MNDQHQQMTNEILEIHDQLKKHLGVAMSLDRLTQLTSAVVIASSLHRVADAIENQDENK